MKVKTSITISDNILNDIDHINGKSKNRSLFIEKAVISYLEEIKKRKEDKKDLKIINESADRLNNEAEDILDFQVKI